MTFSEFEGMPEPVNGRNELHNGELIFVAPPILEHYLIQRRLRKLLEREAADQGEVEIEMAIQATAEHNYRVADVAFMTHQRWAKVLVENKIIQGAPDLVIEVLSPTNTSSEILDQEALCLENGSKQFWIVDPERQQVKVSTPDGHTITFKSGSTISLFFGGELPVAQIFVQP